MKTFVGIDPGLKGGIAVVYPLGSTHVSIMPVAGHWIQCAYIIEWLKRECLMPILDPDMFGDVHVVVELVGAMPKQGLSSTFKFGTGYGQIIGMLQTLGIPYSLVRPQAWKAVVLAGTTKDKDAAIAFCRREYPHVNLIPPRCRVPHDGIADALCLAEYGRRTHAG